MNNSSFYDEVEMEVWAKFMAAALTVPNVSAEEAGDLADAALWEFRQRAGIVNEP